MANTSGSINTLTLTRDQIILDVLQDLRQVDQTVTTPSANDVTVCALKLNLLLRRLPIGGALLWTRDTLVIPTVANKNTYTIGPSGADFTSYRPLRCFNGSFIRFTSGTQNFDTTLTLLSRLEYDQLGNKGALGVANSFYYDPQMTTTPNVAYNPANAMGILKLYVEPSDASRTVYLEVQRPIQEMVSSGDAIDVPMEWYDAIIKGLAAMVADKYEVPEQRIVRIKNEAKAAIAELTDWGATEQAPVTFQPDPQFVMRRG